MYINLNDFGNEIEQNKLTTDQAIEEQNIIYKKYKDLENGQVEKENEDFKQKVLNNVKIYNRRHDIIDRFDKVLFLRRPDRAVEY